ncbi:MAG: hypothetical protein ACO3K9_02585, partial [Paracoccaceae bacterium]|jgi:hypothetical protein|nr:hypothetical protein [Pseudomonadota bacterium]MDA0852500.1 hypothetical protein [Pseudomonadota bacterium]MDA1296329.1 hypothetical protein [Pseudomonadota bacterium]NCW17198.1 hypothetical protein [Paracoccaceae bacterium]
MEKIISFLKSSNILMRQLVETVTMFLCFVILIYLLLGEHSGTFVVSVIANLSILINVITPQVLASLGLGIALLYLFKNR